MNTRLQSRGSALITVLFVVIVIATFVATMTSLSTVQQDTVNKSLQASRVYYGARAGLDWAVQRTITDTAPPARCAAINGASLTPAGDGLGGVSVTVACTSSQHGTSTTSFTYYVTANATVGTLGALSYAERRMEATVSNIP